MPRAACLRAFLHHPANFCGSGLSLHYKVTKHLREPQRVARSKGAASRRIQLAQGAPDRNSADCECYLVSTPSPDCVTHEKSVPEVDDDALRISRLFQRFETSAPSLLVSSQYKGSCHQLMSTSSCHSHQHIWRFRRSFALPRCLHLVSLSEPTVSTTLNCQSHIGGSNRVCPK